MISPCSISVAWPRDASGAERIGTMPRIAWCSVPAA
jgi:hypothetical protein